MTGELGGALDARQLGRLVAALAPGQPEQALLLLNSASDPALRKMFVGTRLAQELEDAFPPGGEEPEEWQAELEYFYARRFADGPAAVAAGSVQPLEVYPVEVFRPELFDRRLAGLKVDTEPAPGQVREVLA